MNVMFIIVYDKFVNHLGFPCSFLFSQTLEPNPCEVINPPIDAGVGNNTVYAGPTPAKEVTLNLNHVSSTPTVHIAC